LQHDPVGKPRQVNQPAGVAEPVFQGFGQLVSAGADDGRTAANLRFFILPQNHTSDRFEVAAVFPNSS
jgi:hypothetical protein